MKSKFLIILVAYLMSTQSFGQNPVWAIPNNTSASTYLVNGFPHILPTTNPSAGGAPYLDVLGTDGGYVPADVPHYGAANAIAGPDGNLLFFIIGGNRIFYGYSINCTRTYTY